MSQDPDHQSRCVLLTINIPEEKGSERAKIYEQLEQKGLKKVPLKNREGVSTVFIGSLTTVKGPLAVTPDIDTQLDKMLDGCSYIFMWADDCNVGGSEIVKRLLSSYDLV